ncbi:conserved hypothetical protein [Ricinus communis]|uniref:Uncharacterized protein n=1 Tax=Ricinus communis TaxID=3988 RepID=B9SK14_RICCO|nr:conserved hypothetical protein [Ricinus communis]
MPFQLLHLGTVVTLGRLVDVELEEARAASYFEGAGSLEVSYIDFFASLLLRWGGCITSMMALIDLDFLPPYNPVGTTHVRTLLGSLLVGGPAVPDRERITGAHPGLARGLPVVFPYFLANYGSICWCPLSKLPIGMPKPLCTTLEAHHQQVLVLCLREFILSSREDRTKLARESQLASLRYLQDVSLDLPFLGFHLKSSDGLILAPLEVPPLHEVSSFFDMGVS